MIWIYDDVNDTDYDLCAKFFFEYFCLATIVGDNGEEGDIGAVSVLI